MAENDRKILVVIAEDEELIRRGMENKIRSLDPDFYIAASVGDGNAALEAVRKYKPQVVITDIKMPKMDGLELARCLNLTSPSIKVVIVSGYSDFEYTQSAIRYGVFNYLLKPVSEEALRDMLTELKARITAYRYQQNRTVIYSQGYQLCFPPEYRYSLFAVCMGNLCYDVRDELLTEYYEQQQAKISWHELLNRPEFADMEWYVADEEEKNQKMICFSGVPENLKDNETTAGELQKILSEALNGIPVSICTEAEPMEKKDIWICARRLRNILQHKVVLAQGSVFVLERDEPFQENEALEIVKMRITDHLLPHLQKRDKEAVSGELNLIFGYLSENPVPQADIQRILLYILRLMEFSEERFVDLQQDVFRAMSMMSAPAGIKQELSRILMKCLGSSTAAEDSESLSLQMKGYLDKNYTSIRNLGDLASVFSYSYAYLSRIFTRENGISMTRYVLEKRMELAEHLIREHKNLSIQQVAEMTGYDDGRYFSGLFKNYTGMTPSEYKAAEN